MKSQSVPIGFSLTSVLCMIVYGLWSPILLPAAQWLLMGVGGTAALIALVLAMRTPSPWTLTLAVVAILFGLGVTARLWLPALLVLLDIQSDRIQALANLIQMILWGGGGVIFLYRLTRRSSPEQATERISADRNGEMIVVADPDMLWRVIANRRPSADLREATEQYFTYLVSLYRFLDFRGMGMSIPSPKLA